MTNIVKISPIHHHCFPSRDPQRKSSWSQVCNNVLSVHEVSWMLAALLNRKALCFTALAVEEEAGFVKELTEHVPQS